MAIDKPEETAESIMKFFDHHSNHKATQLALSDFD
jgi:hypothetical protein